MTRYPWMVFQNTASTELDKIPLNGNLQIIDDSALADGTGGPKYITVIDLTTCVAGNTIADLLAAPTEWLEISSPEKGGVAWGLGTDYLIGDTVSEGGLLWVSLADHISADLDVADGSPTQSLQTSWISPEIAGRAHSEDGVSYKAGDTVTYGGGRHVYVCVFDHISAPLPGTGPCLGDAVNWTQPVISAEYTFTTDILGDAVTVPGDLPDPAIPPAGDPLHTYEGDGSTNIPNESGPHWFSIAPTPIVSADIQLEGVGMNPINYDISVPGYIYMNLPIADNSWIKIITRS